MSHLSSCSIQVSLASPLWYSKTRWAFLVWGWKYGFQLPLWEWWRTHWAHPPQVLVHLLTVSVCYLAAILEIGHSYNQELLELSYAKYITYHILFSAHGNPQRNILFLSSVHLWLNQVLINQENGEDCATRK